MIQWFREIAPVRTKFNVMIVVFTSLTAVLVIAIFIANSLETFYLNISAAILLLLTFTFGTLSKKIICDPYVETVVRMEGLAEGQFDAPIAHTEFKDCVGRMTRAMDVFRRNGIAVAEADRAQREVVGALGSGLSKLAMNDLTHRINTPFPSDYERLRVDFNYAMDAVTKVIAAVREAASGINNGADDIRQASDDLSQRTEQQAASLEETAAAMDEVTATVKETAADALRANAVVQEARCDAENSGDVVVRAVGAMSAIERGSIEISEIISVIDGIAFQTNLLALNAGVEAARAGDAGKGFAVVASEVRALAQRSAEAAKVVKAKITASSEQVSAGVDLVNETGHYLQRIIGRIGEISTLVGTIAASAEQQANGLQQVNVAVGEMDSVTQQNAAMVEEATAAARSLAEEADALVRQVASFNTRDNGFAPIAMSRSKIDPAPLSGRVVHLASHRLAARGGSTSVATASDWSEF